MEWTRTRAGVMGLALNVPPGVSADACFPPLEGLSGLLLEESIGQLFPVAEIATPGIHLLVGSEALTGHIDTPCIVQAVLGSGSYHFTWGH